MLDTVRVGFDCVDLDPAKLKRLGWTKAVYERGQTDDVTKTQESWSLRREHESPHFLAWYPASGRLKAETSFPKMLYSDNVTLVRPDDVDRGIDKLSEVLTACTDHPIDARNADVQGRVDFVFAFDTAWEGRGHVGDYLDAFKSLELPRHYTENVARDATLYWRNGARVIRMYDKFKESRLPVAKDMLRFEVQSNHAKKDLTALVPGLSMKLSDVARWDVAQKVLGTYLDMMGADLPVSNERKLAQQLVEAVGPARARRLMGYIVFLRLYGRDGMVRMGFDRTMPFRDKRALEEVGLAAAVHDRAGESGLLPGLRLPRKYSGEPLRLAGGDD